MERPLLEAGEQQPERPGGGDDDEHSTLSLRRGALQRALREAETIAPPATHAAAATDDAGGAAPRGPAREAEPERTLAPGDTVGRYEIIRLIGRGGMGEVYQARDLRLARRVAIKLLSKSSPLVRERFLVEAQTTARCNHENIVVIHEVGEHGERPYLVLEYLRGQNLREWWQDSTETTLGPDGCAARTPVSPRRVVEIMVPVMRALVCAHAHGIVHRDLKPENIMLLGNGATKVLDFGIAKQLEDDIVESMADTAPVSVTSELSLTKTGRMIGTLPYMSPEQMDAGVVDHRTDLWAVGIMLFELALGYHPVLRGSVQALFEIAELDVPMPRVDELAPELGQLGAVIDRCLIKDRADRIDSAKALLAELEALLPARAALAAGERPFAGLAPFERRDADRFFGRDQEIASLVRRVRSQAMVVTMGPSGAGKSSLVRAGLIPALERSGEGWVSLTVRPGRTPLAMLGNLLHSLSQTSSGSREVTATVDSDDPEITNTGVKLSSDAYSVRMATAPGLFGATLRTWARRKRRRVVVFVDQFEELYTLGADAAERAAFVACLDGAADDIYAPVRVVLSLRADFFERVAESPAFLEKVSRCLFFVSPLGRAGLRQALVRPVEAADHAYEDDALVDEMLDALADTASALPLLQFAASALWERRDTRRRLLTRAGYAEMGGMAGALAVHADRVLDSMTRAQQQLARAMFLHLLTSEHTRAPVDLSELLELPGDTDAIEAVIARLVDARLLVIAGRRGDGDCTVEIIHESLISSWPTLGAWLDETREDAAFRARLRAAARQWDEHRRRDGLLWRGEPAREASVWQARYGGELPARDRAYLDAVLRLGIRHRRLRRVLLGGAIAAVALLISAALFFDKIHKAQFEALRAAELAQDRADALTVARDRQDELLERAQGERRLADDARQQAEVAQRQAEVAWRQAEVARDNTERALDETRAARVRAEATAKQLSLVNAKLQHAEHDARIAQQRAEEAAERERALKEELSAVIQRALGVELSADIPARQTQAEETP